MIRNAYPGELSAVGRLLVDVYARLPGFPTQGEQPAYYEMLANAADRTKNPATSIFVAAGDAGELLGSVDFISDMAHYGASGSARNVPDAAGMRLLAVAPEARGRGIGKALARFCVERARELGKKQIVLHTTRSMATAWAMYEKLGFARYPEIDFRQGTLDVFGFYLSFASSKASNVCQ